MKTLTYKILVGAIAVLAMVGCDKKKSNNNGYNNGYYNQYNQYYQTDAYGNCIDRRTGQQVQSNLCYNQGGNYNNRYQIDQMSGYCVDIYTRQPVQYSYCQNYNQGGNGYYQQCYGYYYTQYGSWTYCSSGFSGGSSCSGQTLYSQNGQMVMCQ